MFIDNTRKIICLSVPGTGVEPFLEFLKEHFENNSINVSWYPNNTLNPSSIPSNLIEEFAKLGIGSDGNMPVNQENALELFERTENTRDGQTVSDMSGKIKFDKLSEELNQLLNSREILTLENISSKNVLLHPISEYDIYGICSEPVTRLILGLEKEMTVVFNDPSKKRYVSNIIFNSEGIKTNILGRLSTTFVENIGVLREEVLSSLPTLFYNQTSWLKPNGQVINHIYKYDNFLNFVFDICAKYNIDSSLYEDRKRTDTRQCTLTADDVSLEIKTKILERYAEDKTLYDSL